VEEACYIVLCSEGRDRADAGGVDGCVRLANGMLMFRFTIESWANGLSYLLTASLEIRVLFTVALDCLDDEQTPSRLCLTAAA
jgi:hypothetical protein